MSEAKELNGHVNGGPHKDVVRYGHILDGKEVFGSEWFDDFAPETGLLFALCAKGDAEIAERGVQAAKAAFKSWSRLPPSAREKPLLTAADLLEGAVNDPKSPHKALVDALIDESGSTLMKAKFEAMYTAQILRTAAGEARRLYGETFPNDKPNRMSMVIREPVGVVAVVSPFNAPLVLLAKMVLFALAAGNTVVAKPSEETPAVAVLFAKLMREAGLPNGVFNVVLGLGAEVGKPLCDHKDVSCIAFTGSVETGARLGSAAVRSMKRIQLELGGKNPLIVCADIATPGAHLNIEKAAQQAAFGAFFHGGQICMASTRIIVEKAVAEQFLQQLVRQVERLHLGGLREMDTAYGPMINERALDKVKAHKEDAVKLGAKVLTGGKVKTGLVYEPTLLLIDDATKHAEAWTVETFGPIACVYVVDSFDAAIELANESEYGLSAGVLTNDLVKGMRAVREVRAGSVHIGMQSFQSDSLAPIGGYGMSGLGKSGGKYSMEHFTEQKWCSIELGETPVLPSFSIPA